MQGKVYEFEAHLSQLDFLLVSTFPESEDSSGIHNMLTSVFLKSEGSSGFYKHDVAQRDKQRRVQDKAHVFKAIPS